MLPGLRDGNRQDRVGAPGEIIEQFGENLLHADQVVTAVAGGAKNKIVMIEIRIRFGQDSRRGATWTCFPC